MPLGAAARSSLNEIGAGGAVVDAGVEAQLLDHVVALVLAAGDADGAAAVQLGELADHRADRARRRRDDDGLAFLGLADHHQAPPRRHARHAQHGERGRERRGIGIELHRRGAVGHGVALPARIFGDEVAFLEPGIFRLHDLADGAADHGIAQIDVGGVALGLGHAPAHVGIERHPDGARQVLAVLGLGDGGVDDVEIGAGRLALGTRLQQHATIGGHGVLLFRARLARMGRIANVSRSSFENTAFLANWHDEGP